MVTVFMIVVVEVVRSEVDVGKERNPSGRFIFL